MASHGYGDIFEYGLKDNKLLHVDDVANGKSCECTCPNCGSVLVAYNNPKNKKVHHFQHLSNAECRNYYETVLHYMAKQVIEENKSLVVPEINFQLSSWAESYSSYSLAPYERKEVKRSLVFESVIVEKNAKDIRPDLMCITNGKTLYIEIAVSHFVDEVKRNKIKANNFPVLEIDLSGFSREVQKEQLIKTLKGKIGNMKWIHNSKIQLRHERAEAITKLIKTFISANSNELKVYGKEQLIYNCPIFKECYDKIKLQDECNRCRFYVNASEGLYDPDEQPKYPDISLNCIGHKADEFNLLLTSFGITWKK